MKITVFTSNQPRHLSLIEDVAKICDTVYAVVEVTTVFPGEIADFYRKSEIMQVYFKKVMEAEKQIFGLPRFLPKKVHPLIIKMEDLNALNLDILAPALSSDLYIVFGASYIKDPLITFLVSQNAYNIHIGVSPQYRGSSCNFWAAYKGNLEYVGATIHLLSRGLDSGAMLFHALPHCDMSDPFLLGMHAVKAAHKGLIERIRDKSIFSLTPVAQDRTKEVLYTRNADFTDEVARDYLLHLPSPETIRKKLKERDLSRFLHPYVG
ncbi:MAG: methionyl-tRNA formyltransferase [Parcubacteria group bacterium]|nr:methionyl-tRNA formyltransferase [Parcubacteria group bacterium]